MISHGYSLREIPGGVTTPEGFLAAGVHCGIKKAKKDLALVVSQRPAVGAAVFTTSAAAAAPVIVSRMQLEASPAARAIVVNSGNANACTGQRGMEDAWTMARLTAAQLGIPLEEVLVSSTGVIGQLLPIDRIAAGIPLAAAALSTTGHAQAAQAICTTDTFTKELAVQLEIDGRAVRLGGMAKGSGMIAPNMATMLAFVTTDAAIRPAVLQTALRDAVNRSFNRISVDGDMSTNDMVAVLANSASGTGVIASAEAGAYAAFYAGLEHLLVRLSKMIVMDGEGATKFIEVAVAGAATDQEAVTAARAVANSNLVKTAIHGEDANWGRIIAALGSSGVMFDPADVEIAFGDLPILGRNYAVTFSEEKAREVLGRGEILITVDLNRGSGKASFWTCDLSAQYVAINANYRT